MGRASNRKKLRRQQAEEQKKLQEQQKANPPTLGVQVSEDIPVGDKFGG